MAATDIRTTTTIFEGATTATRPILRHTVRARLLPSLLPSDTSMGKTAPGATRLGADNAIAARLSSDAYVGLHADQENPQEEILLASNTPLTDQRARSALGADLRGGAYTIF